MAANTVGTDDAHAPADDPYRAVAEHLPGAGTCIEVRAASQAPP
jgi:hypothetical protein